MAAIVSSDPDWSALPTDAPPHVVALLRHTLVKDPRNRLRDIGEARILLGEPVTPDHVAGGVAARAHTGGRSGWIVAAVASVLVVVLLALELLRPEPETGPQLATRFALDESIVSSGFWGGNLIAVSANGGTMAYIGVYYSNGTGAEGVTSALTITRHRTCRLSALVARRTARPLRNPGYSPAT